MTPKPPRLRQPGGFLRDGNVVTTFEPPASMSLSNACGHMDTMEQLEA